MVTVKIIEIIVSRRECCITATIINTKLNLSEEKLIDIIAIDCVKHNYKLSKFFLLMDQRELPLFKHHNIHLTVIRQYKAAIRLSTIHSVDSKQ